MSQTYVLPCEHLPKFPSKEQARRDSNRDRARRGGGRTETFPCPAGHYHWLRVPNSTRRRNAETRAQRARKR